MRKRANAMARALQMIGSVAFDVNYLHAQVFNGSPLSPYRFNKECM